MNILQEFATQPVAAVLYVIILLFSFLIHEYGHAWAAIAMGDDTPLVNGRFLWNPLRYLNPVGILLIVLVGFGFGGQVMTNPSKYRNRQFGEVLVSVAGVFMNLMLVIILGFVLRFVVIDMSLTGDIQLYWWLGLLERAVLLNIALFVFNLLPIPPLDGASLLAALVPGRFGAALKATQHNSSYLLFVAVIVLQQPIRQLIDVVQGAVLRIFLTSIN